MTYDRDRDPDFDDDNNELWDDELSLDEYTDSDDSDQSDHDYYQDNTDSDAPYDHDYYSDPTEDPDENSNEDSDEDSDNSDIDYYSTPQQEDLPAKKSVKERIFGGSADDEDGNDFFSSEAIETPPEKKFSAPRLDPEDPDYWIQEESPISQIINRPPRSWKWMLSAALILIVLICGVWVWFLRPYAEGSVKYGYITKMERRGSLLKTFEGVMIPYKEIGDPDPLHFEELHFSVDGDSLASVMKRMMLDCIPVRVEFETYHAPLLWKGEETMVVVNADAADPSKILPPEYRR